jgi:TolA-binding protein
VVKNYPDNPKAADALLNIASSQAELKDKAAAKKTLEQLIAKYPNTPAAQTGKDRMASLK